MQKGRIPTITLLLIGAGSILVVLAIVVWSRPASKSEPASAPTPTSEVEYLRNDAMLIWKPTAAEGIEQKTDQTPSGGSTGTTRPSIVRTIPLRTDKGALDEAIELAKAAGWKMGKKTDNTSVAGTRTIDGAASNITISVTKGTGGAQPIMTITVAKA